jgi:hypothetical protein
VTGREMSGPLRQYCILTVEGIGGAEFTHRTRSICANAYDSSLTMDTASDSGRGVPIYGPRLSLSDLTSHFFWTFSFSR